MAAQHGDANGFDMSAHTQTFNGFMKLVVWGIVGVVLVLLFLLWIHFA
ncbi:MAG: aa3-type cytochrome c oxidase subunit IV [Alphaproteobacteria bacterium]|nr:aa3-type cytochrome c oxidase subunit IV [Alphaproteobacteria bacterium]